jgi:hypothetical protein
MIELSREILLGAANGIGSVLLAAAKWFMSGSVGQFDARLKNHEERITKFALAPIDPSPVQCHTSQSTQLPDPQGKLSHDRRLEPNLLWLSRYLLKT